MMMIIWMLMYWFEHSGFNWKFHILQKGAVISRDIQRKRPPGASKELDPFKEMSFVSLSLKRMSLVALGQKRWIGNRVATMWSVVQCDAFSIGILWRKKKTMKIKRKRGKHFTEGGSGKVSWIGKPIACEKGILVKERRWNWQLVLLKTWMPKI